MIEIAGFAIPFVFLLIFLFFVAWTVFDTFLYRSSLWFPPPEIDPYDRLREYVTFSGSDEELILSTAKFVWDNKKCQKAYRRVGLTGDFAPFENDEIYDVLKSIIIDGKKDDRKLSLYEVVLRHLAAGTFTDLESDEASDFIANKLAHLERGPLELVTAEDVIAFSRRITKDEKIMSQEKLVRANQIVSRKRRFITQLNAQIDKAADTMRFRQGNYNKRGYGVARLVLGELNLKERALEQVDTPEMIDFIELQIARLHLDDFNAAEEIPRHEVYF